MAREIELESYEQCCYCGDLRRESKLKQDVEGDPICEKCFKIALKENPEIVMKIVYTYKDFQPDAIYL
jgi:hypothetical protein